MFGGAYDDAPPSERPKYGALDFRRRPVGGAPRFGSAHFRLAAHTADRTTFCYPDSVLRPEDFGHGTRVSALIELAREDDTDLLDDYIEAQVHGPIRIATATAAPKSSNSAWNWRKTATSTPGLLGKAGQHDPQALKRVWHYIARFGALP
nr:DUF3626 domain-containing protein [Amycolatopsis pittospori]